MDSLPSRILQPTNPSRFLGVLGVITTLLGVVALIVAFSNPKTQTALVGVAIFLGLVSLWALWPTVVVLVLALKLPAPTPLRERNLFFASASWLIRLFWGATIIVLSGFVGGFIVEQLDAINDAAGKTSDQVAAQLSFSDALFGWTEAIFAVALVALLYVLPLWVAVRALWARKAGRRKAIASLLRVDPRDLDAPPENRQTTWSRGYRGRVNWTLSLASPLYPALFWTGSTLVFSLVTWGTLDLLAAAHTAWNAWLQTTYRP